MMYMHHWLLCILDTRNNHDDYCISDCSEPVVADIIPCAVPAKEID